MADNNIQLKIGDFLGFADLNGVEAIQEDRVQELEEYVMVCNEAHNEGKDLVPDAIYDRLMEILRKVAPDSELCKYIWEDSVDEITDNDSIFVRNPMYSIQTVKSFDCDEIKAYRDRLPDGLIFQAHISVKLNGHGIRLVYKNGDFVQARSRARSSAGRDLTKQLHKVLEDSGLLHIDDLVDFDICEVRGELLIPFSNMAEVKKYNPDVKSAFSAVASMNRDSASEAEWGLLRFVAYEFLAEDFNFSSKESEYSYLEEMGFEIPLNWIVDDISKDNLITELQGIVSDCEEEVKNNYDYYTDGLVFTINDSDTFRTLGDDGSHYKFGNVALKVGYWKQDMYSGYIQTILWMKGKTKFTPVAIVASDVDVIEFDDDEYHPYITSIKKIKNLNELGVVTASGNSVRKVPLYEPANLLALGAYKDEIIYFRYGGEAGVVPCFGDGTPLLDGRVKTIITGSDYDDEEEEYWDEDDYYDVE